MAFFNSKDGGEYHHGSPKTTFRTLLARRTAPIEHVEYLESKPKWGHTPFRGTLFSRPDHVSEVEAHKIFYGRTPEEETEASRKRHMAKERAQSAFQQRTRRTALHSPKKDASDEKSKIKFDRQKYSMDHHDVQTPKYGMDTTSASANTNFVSYLAQSKSPRHSND